MGEAWTCPRCSSTNFASSVVCWNCGLERPAVASPPAAAVPEGQPDSDAETVSRAGEAFPYPGSGVPTNGEPPATPPASPTDPGSIPGWVPATEYQAQPAARPVPLWRRIPIGWLIVLVFIVGGAAVGWYFSAGRGSEGQITKSGDLEAKDLRVGDCFDLKDPSADTIGDVTALPCSADHEFELFYSGSMPEGAFPGDPGFKTYVQSNCFPAFAAYVGTAYDDSELDVYWLQPTDDGWRDGDRSVQCAVYHPRIHRLKESLKGSNQ
jgi:Septum formation